MATVTAASPAFAQGNDVSAVERNSELSVNTRNYSDYNPVGLTAGSFMLYPSVTTGLNFTDNIYANERAAKSDLYTTIAPQLDIRSNFARHELGASFSAKDARYKENSSENYTDYKASTRAKLELNHGLSIPFQAGYQNNHLRRGDPENTNMLEPTEYDTYSFDTGFVLTGHRLELTTTGGVKKFEYEDGLSTAGFIDNQDRNRLESTGSIRFGAPREGRIAPYVYSRYRDVDYDQTVDNSGINRNSTSLGGGVGANFDLMSVTRSELQFGYVTRDIADPRYDDVQDFTYLASIFWEPSTLTSFRVTGEREIEETSLNNTAASIDTSLDFGIRYELAPAIHIAPEVGVMEREFEGNQARKLRRYNAGTEITYKMNRNIWWSAEYEYITQKDPDNSDQIDEFDRNTFLISLKLQL